MDVVHRVAANRAVAGIVMSGRNSFASQSSDPDIAVVMHPIIHDGETLRIPVDGQRLAASGDQIVQFIATDGEIVDRDRTVGACNHQPERIGRGA